MAYGLSAPPNEEAPSHGVMPHGQVVGDSSMWWPLAMMTDRGRVTAYPGTDPLPKFRVACGFSSNRHSSIGNPQFSNVLVPHLGVGAAVFGQ